MTNEIKSAWARAYYEAVAAQNDALAALAYKRYYEASK